jgi:Ni,Fe-hydrogenase III large subunit
MTDSLWMQITTTAYAVADSKGQERMKYRFITEIAESLLENHPDSAHLYALEKLQGGQIPQIPEMWRQVLIELDRLQGEKNASIELQKTEQHRT